MEQFIQVFGWVVLIAFVAVALFVVGFSIYMFLSLPVRVLATKISSEVKLLKEDIAEKSQMKRVRLAAVREKQDELAKQKLNAQYGAALNFDGVENHELFGDGETAANGQDIAIEVTQNETADADSVVAEEQVVTGQMASWLDDDEAELARVPEKNESKDGEVEE